LSAPSHRKEGAVDKNDGIGAQGGLTLDYREEDHMFTRTSLLAAVALAAGLAGAAHAQPYPSKTVRVVVPFPAGGGTDILARPLAQKLNEAWGQPVFVDNRAGAGSTIGNTLVARAAPDGYTLLLMSASISVVPAIYRNLPYDTVKDLAAITLLMHTPYVLVVHPSMPTKSVRDLIRLAKSKPGQVIYGSAGAGTITHFTVELFRSMAKIDILHVPFKGGAPSLQALMSGEVQMVMNVMPEVLPHLRAGGRMRPLGVSSAKRMEVTADLPTITEAGVPGFESVVWFVLMAPAGTPPAIIAGINGEVNRILRDPELLGFYRNLGYGPLGGTPEAAGEQVKREIARWAKVAREAGIKPVD
jgi:tripartite-type tricarboxylate transporter receptor subunit TctC